MFDAVKTTPQGTVVATDSQSDETSSQQARDVDTRSSNVPWTMKVIAVILVSAIGFGSHWSSGVTGAMKSTLKKVRGSSCQLCD